VGALSDSTVPSGAEHTPVARHSVRANVAHMMSSQLVTWLLATLAAVIIPRFLGPATLGDLRLATSLCLITATIVGLGTSQYLQLEIARSSGEGLSLVGPILIVRSLAFTACALVLALYLAATGASAQFVVILTLLGVSTLAGQWAEVYGTSFMGLERMSTTAFAGAATKALNFVAVLGVLIAGAGVLGVVTVSVVTAVAGLAYLVWQFRRIARLSFDDWRPLAKRAVRGGVTFMAAGSALVLYQQIDIIVISAVAENEDLGWYGAADVLFGSLLFPATVIMGAIFPTLGRLSKEDPEQLRDLVRRTFSILALLAVPIGLGTTLVGPDFAPMLYGEEFRPTGVSLAILGPVIVFTFGTILFGATALATGRGLFWAGVIFGAALLTIPLDVLLVPWANDRFENGAIGGALAYVVTEGYQFAVGLVFIVPFLATRAVAWRTIRILAAGAMMFAVGWPLRHLPLPIPVLACSVAYAIAVVALRVLGDDERRMVGEVLARVGVRTSWAA
jgi:O-antigen/teichoic acid export membrane protein